MTMRERLIETIQSADAWEPAALADAVLEAMMEPTPLMYEAAAEVEYPAYRDFAICMKLDWQAMLTAARSGA